MSVIVKQFCRLCGSGALTPVINLGDQMLASAFVSEENESRIPLRKVPLEVVRCNPEIDENACGLVQLRHTFPADLIYSEYWYLSGVNKTMRDALADIARRGSEWVNLEPGDLVVDIGCNDGTLLNSYLIDGIEKIGFDPAQNLANQEGEQFLRISSYFSRDSCLQASGGKQAKIVTSIAMFYDVDDPNGFMAQVADILDENGIWILQIADLPNMITNNMFDSICHEHLCYYHLAPIEILLKRNGLRLADIEMNDINGSSYRFFITKASGSPPSKEVTMRIANKRFEEFNMALDTDAPYREFEANIQKNKHDLLFFLKQKKEEGEKVFVCGASTKGNVLLQFCGIDTSLVPFAAERNPRKWGMRTIGTNIPIISEEEARAMNPDYFLVLPYHFLDEIMEREKAFIERGGKFIVPVPHVRLVPS